MLCPTGSDAKKRFPQAQLIGLLHEGDSTTVVKDLCRHHGSGEASYYPWRFSCWPFVHLEFPASAGYTKRVFGFASVKLSIFPCHHLLMA